MSGRRSADGKTPVPRASSEGSLPRYERPVIMELGDLARGVGGACGAGTAVDCMTGGNAVGLCNQGSNNTGPCPNGVHPS